MIRDYIDLESSFTVKEFCSAWLKAQHMTDKIGTGILFYTMILFIEHEYEQTIVIERNVTIPYKYIKIF